MLQFLDEKHAELKRELVKARKGKTPWMVGGDMAPGNEASYNSRDVPNPENIFFSSNEDFQHLRDSTTVLFYVGIV